MFFGCIIESKISVKFKVMCVVMNCLCCRDDRCSPHVLTFTFGFFNLASSLASAPLCRFARRRRLEPGTSAGAGCTNCEASAVPEDCLTSLLVSGGTQRCSFGILTQQCGGSWIVPCFDLRQVQQMSFPRSVEPGCAPPPHSALFAGYVPGALLLVAERLGCEPDHTSHLVPMLRMCGAVTSLPRMPSWRPQEQFCGLPCLSL